MLIKTFVEYFFGKDGFIVRIIFDHACVSRFTFPFRVWEVFCEQLIRILYQVSRLVFLFLDLFIELAGLQLDLNHAVCSVECVVALTFV